MLSYLCADPVVTVKALPNGTWGNGTIASSTVTASASANGMSDSSQSNGAYSSRESTPGRTTSADQEDQVSMCIGACVKVTSAYRLDR